MSSQNERPNPDGDTEDRPGDIHDLEDAVIAADDTGMVRSEALIVEAEIERDLEPEP